MLHRRFILDSFKKLDLGDQAGFLSQLTSNVQWRMNEEQVCHGKEAVHAALKQLYAAIYESSHNFLNVWEVDDTYIITADLTIKTITKKFTEIPWTAVVKVKDGLMDSIEIYSDITKVGHEQNLN